jgi:hypothetical protein
MQEIEKLNEIILNKNKEIIELRNQHSSSEISGAISEAKNYKI